MKVNREHRVPLSYRAAEILRTARTLRNGGNLVFPSPRGKSLSDMTLSKLLKEQGVRAVPHGFRSSFRDWASEETNHPREVVEAALAHQVRDKVEAAYARSTLFDRRRRLMGDWAAYLASVPSPWFVTDVVKQKRQAQPAVRARTLQSPSSGTGH